MSSAKKIAPTLMYISGAIYLVFAAYLVILTIDQYQGGLGGIISLLEPYFAYGIYILPIALVLGFVGWYYGGATSPSANLFLTIGSATLMGSFFIYWALTGALLDTLFALWVYWIPSAINLILGAYVLAGKSMVTPPPSVIEPLFEKHRRALRPTYQSSKTKYQAIRPINYDELDVKRRRILRYD